MSDPNEVNVLKFSERFKALMKLKQDALITPFVSVRSSSSSSSREYPDSRTIRDESLSSTRKTTVYPISISSPTSIPTSSSSNQLNIRLNPEEVRDGSSNQDEVPNENTPLIPRGSFEQNNEQSCWTVLWDCLCCKTRQPIPANQPRNGVAGASQPR